MVFCGFFVYQLIKRKTHDVIWVLWTLFFMLVLLGILEYARGGDAEAMVSRPRLHHQYLPDVVRYETGGLPGALRDGLNLRGHVLEAQPPWGNMQVVTWERAAGRLDAASDPRGIGEAIVK